MFLNFKEFACELGKEIESNTMKGIRGRSGIKISPARNASKIVAMTVDVIKIHAFLNFDISTDFTIIIQSGY